MKHCSGSLFAMLVSISLLAGCASTGTTPAGSAAEEATTAPATKASETKAPAKRGGSEPECD